MSPNKLAYMVVVLGLALFVELGSSDFEQDKAECTDKLVGLATCLPFVSGESKNPTPDCCVGFKQVVDKNGKCLCVLIRNRDNPSLGLKVNTTLALQLPSDCHAPFNVTKCIDLLHLKADSKEAKEFEGFAKDLANGNKTTSSPPSPGNSTGGGKSASASMKDSSGSRKSWQGIQMVFLTLLWFLLPMLLFSM
ncbi:non-specific lipid transfer protein GPI-anchored 6-like [Humulus lupulus]|uniref:non-specific lipid transfer protein GPI-anchored 6-like n=1 Tax=Humulus lupulus TaxID=3486 RepID=UPI002B40D264|nr:non-specific lipid transfer protein GPI-anchored 6-like [Humulus lupulus]